MALPTSNLSKLRRYLQGAGIDYHRAITPGVDNDPNIGTRTPVPGLLDDSVVSSVSIQDGATGIIVEGAATWLPERFASTTINDEVANAALVYTAKTQLKTFVKQIDTNVANDPLVVSVNAALATGDEVHIEIQLSQSGAAVPTATAAQVRVAVLQHPEVSKLLGAEFAAGNDGTGLMTPTIDVQLGLDPDATTSDPILAYLNRQGATYATLQVPSVADANGNNDNDIVVEGQVAGDQTALTFAIVIAGNNTVLSVTGVSPNVVVNGATGPAGASLSTAKEVVDKVMATAAAAAMVRVAVKPTPDGRTKGDGIVAAFVQTPLVLGQVAGVVLTGDQATAPKSIIIEWYDRRNAGVAAHSF